MANWIKNADQSYWQLSNVIQFYVALWNPAEDPAADGKYYIWAQAPDGAAIRFSGGPNLTGYVLQSDAQAKLDSAIGLLGGAYS